MKKVILTLFLGIFLSTGVWGFDGQRKGFILGGGLGLGMTSFQEELGGFKFDRVNKLALMTDFKIGYAPNEQWEIYYSDKSSWFDVDGTIALHGLGTASINYYLKPLAPTFYLSGGLGLATISTPFENNTDTDIGVGFFAGAGYEFVRHFAVQFDFMFGMPQESSGGVDYTFTGLTPRVSVIATAF